MEKNHVTIRCDESVRSDALIKRLKGYDRRLARHTLEEYGYMESFISEKDCIVGAVVNECRERYRYVRCIITGKFLFCQAETEFYDCYFIDTDSIYGATIYGESVAIGINPVAINIRVPKSSVIFEKIRINKFNEIVEDEEKHWILVGNLANQHADTIRKSVLSTYRHPALKEIIDARKTNLVYVSLAMGVKVGCPYINELIMEDVD